MNIRKALDSDLSEISNIYEVCFPRESNHGNWVRACFSSAPKSVYYVIESESQIIGYILWCVKNGFRAQSIVELEQIGIHPDHSGKGHGKLLVKLSFSEFQQHVKDLGFSIGAILVTTSEGNYAEKIYKSTIGVRTAATINGYGSGNELILFKNIRTTHEV